VIASAMPNANNVLFTITTPVLDLAIIHYS